jgi:glycosyltransferase involved in cell wall biosynthesis
MSAHDFFATCPNGSMFDFHARAPCWRVPMSTACALRNCDRRNRVHKVWRLARHAMLRAERPAKTLPPQLMIHRAMGPLFALAGIPADRLVPLPNPVIAWSDNRVTAEANEAALFVGRIEGTKGADIAAMACRLAKTPLLAVGGGTELAAMRRNFPEMEFAGPVVPSAVVEHARRARMLIMPSRYNEPFGLTAIEAAWSGIPVIISRHALIAEDLVAAGAAIAIDPEDPRDIANAVERLAHDDDLVSRMSNAAFSMTRHLALRHDEWIDALLTGYQALLDGGAAALVASIDASVVKYTNRELHTCAS